MRRRSDAEEPSPDLCTAFAPRYLGSSAAATDALAVGTVLVTGATGLAGSQAAAALEFWQAASRLEHRRAHQEP